MPPLHAALLAGLTPVVAYPFQFNLGPLQFTGFGIAVVVAFVVGQIVSQEQMVRLGLDPTPIGDIVVAAVVGGLLGAKLYFVIVLGNWDALFARGGFVFWGGLIGGVIAVILVGKRKKIPLWTLSDVVAPALAAAYAIGRTGCWAVGDDYGRPFDGDWAVKFPEGAPASTVGVMESQFGVHFPVGTDPAMVVSVHPTELYEVAMGLIMFAILWRMRRHRHAPGWLFGVYCVLAGIERFVVEFYRAKDDHLGIGITQAQLIGIAAVVIGAVLIWMRRERSSVVVA
jgi:phosphatidylglycerol---prolipoprotein diacylglyceryl transferase